MSFLLGLSLGNYREVFLYPKPSRSSVASNSSGLTISQGINQPEESASIQSRRTSSIVQYLLIPSFLNESRLLDPSGPGLRIPSPSKEWTGVQSEVGLLICNGR